jgi:hypothetical protein
MKWAEHVARMGDRRGAYRVLVDRREPKHRWEDNIKMDHQELERGAWTGLIWFRIVTGGGFRKCGN